MGFVNWYKRMLEKYHATINSLFSAYGSFVAHHPFIPITIGILLLGAFCIGLIRAQKETDLERLWVEQKSRVVPEKNFFDSRFGGLSRKEAVSINLKESLDANFNDLRHAMDALRTAIKPLYDNLTMNVTIDGTVLELKQQDFCERPQVPVTLKSGKDPISSGNWLAWGYRFVSECALNSTILVFPSFNRTAYGLPEGWGIDVFPCFKLTPMDCFKEGQEFDYPVALQQLDQLVILDAKTNATLKNFVYGFEQYSQSQCLQELNYSLTHDFKSSQIKTKTVIDGVKLLISVLPAWGYSWRPSYRNMTNEQILDHINAAIENAKNPNRSLSDPLIQHCILENKPCCMSWFGGPIPITAALGSISYDSSGRIAGIGAMRWGTNHWNSDHPLWVDYITKRLNISYRDEQRKKLVVAWENLLIENLIPLRENKVNTTFADGELNQDLQIQFTMWKSTEDVLADANKTPVWQLILSAVLVCLYSFLAFVNLRNPVHSHTMLVFMGLVVVFSSIIAGFGLTAAFGIKFSPLAGSVVPFLALGLGIDDVFVLVSILRNFLEDPKVRIVNPTGSTVPEHEMRLTLALAGPSVVLTTFSVLAAFFISSVNPMPIVRWFCWQMGITASIHTCGMLLIFMPIMSIDAQRVKIGVVDPILWLLCGFQRQTEPITKADMQMYDPHDPAILEHNASSPISVAVAKFYAPLFNSNIFKVTVVILYAGFLGSMTYLGFWKVQHGLKLSEVTLKGSYQHDFVVVTEDKFPDYDIWLVTQNISDYSAAQDNLLQMYNVIKQNLSYWTPNEPSILGFSWLGNLYGTLNQTNSIPYPIPPKNFNELAQSWSTSVLGLLSLQDLYCQNSTTQNQTSCFAENFDPLWSIGATKTAIFAERLGADTETNLDLIRKSRKAADDLNDRYFNGTKVAYIYGYPFLFFEQYLHSSHDLYFVVGFALVGVFVAVLVFQFSLVVSIIIALVLLMVSIEVYGFIYIIGAKLNSLSLVNLGIVVGMASEFTYIARSFLVVDGTRNHRVGKALEWTFEPLLHGFGTQVAATLPLIFLRYHAFRIYYFAMFTVMGVLGLLNGFLLMPVLLSWFGPPPLPHVRQQSTRIKLDSTSETEKLSSTNEKTKLDSTNGTGIPSSPN